MSIAMKREKKHRIRLENGVVRLSGESSCGNVNRICLLRHHKESRSRNLQNKMGRTLGFLNLHCLCVYVCLTLSVCLSVFCRICGSIFFLLAAIIRFLICFFLCNFFFLLLSFLIKKDALRWLSSTSVAGNFKKKKEFRCREGRVVLCV